VHYYLSVSIYPFHTRTLNDRNSPSITQLAAATKQEIALSLGFDGSQNFSFIHLLIRSLISLFLVARHTAGTTYPKIHEPLTFICTSCSLIFAFEILLLTYLLTYIKTDKGELLQIVRYT